MEIVALSKDTPRDAALQKERDELSFLLLSDPDLTVIRRYGIEHHKALEFSTVRFRLFGIPLALVPSIKAMAVPTTLLVDEAGVVRWIDQGDDYRLRSDGARVLSAVTDVWPEDIGGDVPEPRRPGPEPQDSLAFRKDES